ncbi:MAG: peroxiredoxin [Clostridia bacterium]|jgi:peroxiredoxin|nr:peroxiredoxin [Clostridia bacterium]
MKLITVGDSAPDFTLKDNYDKEIRLSDYKGKKVLLSWHPLAWTSVCTDQMRALDVNFETFEKLNTIPLGLSVDPAPCKKAWATAIALSNLSVPSDFWPHGKVAQDYGIFIERFGFSERANIIIDEKGIVRWVKVYPIKQLPDINEVIQVLTEIK